MTRLLKFTLRPQGMLSFSIETGSLNAKTSNKSWGWGWYLLEFFICIRTYCVNDMDLQPRKKQKKHTKNLEHFYTTQSFPIHFFSLRSHEHAIPTAIKLLTASMKFFIFVAHMFNKSTVQEGLGNGFYFVQSYVSKIKIKTEIK